MTVTTLNYTIMSLGTNKNFCFEEVFVNWKQYIKGSLKLMLFIKEKGTYFSLEKIVHMKEISLLTGISC